MLRPLERRARFRTLTSRFRVLPGVYIIGGPRCGTTALYEHLARHPSVAPGKQKEPHFWGSPPGLEEGFSRGVASYRRWYPTELEMELVQKRTGQAVTIDATPVYLYSAEAARRLRRARHKAKLIVLLRNPVDRAISDHNLELSHFEKEKLPLEEAIAEDEARAKTDFRRAYLSLGVYEPHLRTWMAAFPEEQFLILKSEDLFRTPSEVVPKVLDFLELPAADLGEYKKSHGFRYASRPSDATRARLYEHFRPHNARLYEFLGRDFGWEAEETRGKAG
jgi:hypothetical protein